MAPELRTYLEDEVKTSYIDYAMSVIIGRALPDVRDGLKPVQRRILYAMLGLGLTPNRPFRKSATVVGEVIGKYHPHGDAPVYDALVRMAQDFSLRYPLIEGQGNFGSIDGDPPAAYRYTEARLSKIAMEMLTDIDEETVPFVPNFDGRLKEPVVLPSRIPNLLINGASGIAVGMATSIPPHNLNEIVDALVALIDNPELEDEKLFEIVKGPDFPTGGTIVGVQGIREAYLTGKGKITVQAKWHFEEKRGHSQIVFTEIPYAISKAHIIERIAGLVREKKIDGIADLRDESDREGLRIVVELKRGMNPEIVLNRLLVHTPLRSTFGIILLALVDGEPRLLTLRNLLSEYLKHREDVVRKRTEYRLRKARERLHILEGLKIAVENIDRVIEIIKKSGSPREAKGKLIEVFKFSEKQAQAILDTKLQTLTRLEREKIERDYRELLQRIRELESILASKENLYAVVKKELIEIKEKYGDSRRTEIAEEELKELNIKDLIPNELVVVTVTRHGYAKRTPVKSYRQQGRGGTGKSGIKFYEEDLPVAVEVAKNHDRLLIFTNTGKAYVLETYMIQEGSVNAKGKPLKHLINLEKGDKIVAILPIKKFSSNRDILIVTRNGIVKRTPLKNFINAGRRGIIAQNLRDDDLLIDAILVRESDEVVIAKSNGKAVRFHISELRPMNRRTFGVKGVDIESSRVVSALKILKDKKFLTITANGYGKKFSPEEIRVTKRGAKGVKIQKIDTDTGELIGLVAVDDIDDVILLTKTGQTIRFKSKEIRETSRIAKGVRLIKLKEGDSVVDVAVIDRSRQEKMMEELF